VVKRKQIPVALTIAGSDSGGGAGVQADLKTFAALGVHGTSAITCITAQNPKRVVAIQSCSPKIVRQQIEAVFVELRPAAVKTGMLYSKEIIQVVVDFFSRGKRPPLVVDPVMVSTSGTRLLSDAGVCLLKEKLLPLAALVTPNLPEAEILFGKRIKSPADLHAAAKEIHRRFGCAALVKGGHLEGHTHATDFFFDGKNELMSSAPFVRGIRTHGTGCTYSAAITGYLTLGNSLLKSVQLAKDFVTQAIAQSRLVGGHAALNSFWRE
jgi:hydroxymethylpyrimidine/phosphomethylpyrimidine kinase